MIQAKDLARRADAAICFEQLLPPGMIARHAGGKLAAILHVEQYPRNEPGNLVGPLRRTQRTNGLARQVINRGQSALMMKFTH